MNLFFCLLLLSLSACGIFSNKGSEDPEDNAIDDSKQVTLLEIDYFKGEAGFKRAKLSWDFVSKTSAQVDILRKESGDTLGKVVYSGTDLSYEDTDLDFSKEYTYEIQVIQKDETKTPYPKTVLIKPIFSISGTALLESSDLHTGDRFGEDAIAIDGSTMIVGASGDDNGSTDPDYNSGAAYIFEKTKSGWSQSQKLRPNTLLKDERFGRFVAIEKDLAAISSFYGPNDTYLGAVYVYRKIGSTWEFEDRIQTSDGKPYDLFSFQMVIQDGQIISSAHVADATNPIAKADVGAVYVFEKTNGSWIETQKIPAPNPAKDVFFGAGLASDDQTLIITSPLSTGGPNHNLGASGAAYVYQRNSNRQWTLETELFGSEVKPGDSFGFGASIHKDRIAIAAPRDDGLNSAGNNSDFGVVYLFEKVMGTWKQSHMIRRENTNAMKVSQFGWYISLSDDLLFCGTPFDDQMDQLNSGSVSVYIRSDQGWTLKETIYSKNGKTDDLLGSSIALSGNTFVVGAPGQDRFGTTNTHTGAAYVYDFR